MKRTMQRLLVLLICLTLTLTMISGCSGNKQDEKKETIKEDTKKDDTTKKKDESKDNQSKSDKETEKNLVNGVDISKKAELTGYLLGAAPAGMDAVVEKLNEKMLKDINAKVNFRYISWGDLSAKYPLVLASGSDVDFIYTANWAFYAQEAGKGAFYEIKEDEMEKYMPLHYKAIDKVAFDQAKLNGKMYMITTASPDKKIPVGIIRGDLRKKYNVPEIKKFTDIEAYLKAIKENEKSMVPMCLDNSFDIMIPYGAVVNQDSKGYGDILSSTGSGSGLMWSIEDANPSLTAVYDEGTVEHYKEAAKVMKTFYDEGYLNKDAFANKVRSKDSFIQGKSAVGFGNSQDIQSALAVAKKNNWEVEIVPILNNKNHYMADPYINNGVAIAASSENKERTMLALDLILEEESYNNLVYFGVEGVNYVVKDGKVDLPEGVTAETNTYPPDAAGFWFTNKNQHLPLASWDDQYIELRNSIRNGNMLVDHQMSGFAPKMDNIQTEVANLNQSIIQYLQPIGLGMVKDVDEAFKTLESKLKAAGIEKVKEEIQGQIDTYMSQFK